MIGHNYKTVLSNTAKVPFAFISINFGMTRRFAESCPPQKSASKSQLAVAIATFDAKTARFC